MAVISSIVGTTVLNFIDYALIIVVIMIVWYALKFFMVQPPTKEEREAALNEQREAWGGAVKGLKKKREERLEQDKKEQDKKRRVNLASPTIRDIRRTVEATEEAMRYFDDANPGKLKRTVADLNEHLHSMWTHASQLRGKVQGDQRRKVEEAIVKIQTARQQFGQHVKGKVPATAAVDWHTAHVSIRTALDTIHGLCGDIFNKIEEFEQ